MGPSQGNIGSPHVNPLVSCSTAQNETTRHCVCMAYLMQGETHSITSEIFLPKNINPEFNHDLGLLVCRTVGKHMYKNKTVAPFIGQLTQLI